MVTLRAAPPPIQFHVDEDGDIPFSSFKLIFCRSPKIATLLPARRLQQCCRPECDNLRSNALQSACLPSSRMNTKRSAILILKSKPAQINCRTEPRFHRRIALA